MMLSPFPRVLEFQTHSQCSAACTICPHATVTPRFGRLRMSDAQIDRLLRECSAHVTTMDRMIPYFNNEPSLDARLLSILRTIKRYGFFVELSTNMSGMTEAKLTAIVQEGLIDDLRISCFGGTAETYEATMRGLHFARTVQQIHTLRTLLTAHQPTMEVCLILVLAPQVDVMAETRALRALFPDLRIHYYGYLDRAGSLVERNALAVHNSHWSRFRLVGCRMRRPLERLCVYANGEAVLCSQDWERRAMVGNVFTHSIAEVWQSEQFTTLRNQVAGVLPSPPDFICKQCKLALIQDVETMVVYQNFAGDDFMTTTDQKKIVPLPMEVAHGAGDCTVS